MSELTGSELTRLVAHASDSATEIFLVDGSFRRVAGGLGRLEAAVSPGFYKLRFVTGSATVDRLVEVSTTSSGKPVEVRQEGLQFEAAAPLEATLTTHEYQQIPASELSRQVARTVGRGSNLFLFVRDPNARTGRRFESEPGRGVRIETLAGRRIADLSKPSVLNSEDGFAATHLEVDPGTYVLSVDTRICGIQQMAITTCAGWQTQVFLCTRTFRRKAEGEPPDAGNAGLRRADLFSASVAMAMPRMGFEPVSKQARLSELGRQALGRGRNIVREGELRQQLLENKYQDPLLGLFAAHLILLEQSQDRELLDEVMTNLLRMGLGQHPDWLALQLALGEPPQPGIERVLAAPPMLRASWRMLVHATAKYKTLVPRKSLAAEIGPRVIGSGVWLAWRKAGAAATRKARTQAKHGGKRPSRGLLENLEIVLRPLKNEMSVASRWTSPDAVAPRDGAPFSSKPSRKHQYPLGSLEKALLEVLRHQVSSVADLDAQGALETLTRHMGLPASTIELLVGNLVRKMEK